MSASFGFKTHQQSPQCCLCVLWFCPISSRAPGTLCSFAVTYFVVVLDDFSLDQFFTFLSSTFFSFSLSAALTEGFFSTLPLLSCFVFLFLFFSSSSCEKRALFAHKRHGLLIHTHTHILCKHGRYPDPFSRHLLFAPSIPVFHDGLSPPSSPLHLILYSHERTHSHTGCLLCS